MSATALRAAGHRHGAVPPSPDREAAHAAMEARVERDRARAERLLDLARQLGGDASARVVTLIPETMWGRMWRGLILHDLGMSPYADWNVAMVTTAPHALEAGALPDWPQMALLAEAKAGRGLSQIDAALRADGDADAARKALEALARAIRKDWERHATRGE